MTWVNWNNIDLPAYWLGYGASKRHDSDPAQYPNPYEPGTIAWKSFNWGWNSHDPHAKDEEESQCIK
jgi:hypothetical protein